jgi:hypothetical protein
MVRSLRIATLIAVLAALGLTSAQAQLFDSLLPLIANWQLSFGIHRFI